ncbi:helix-turn-helix domain-containing protein [Butyricicoccus pullicaecorum]|uniref:helix-turn-helix domain-containing protein n=1 Tax=Butyricicoccus pullicaecorum TaxID=501571 RepID=UPI003522DE14
MIRYRFDILEALKEAGYSTYRLRKEKIMGEALIQKIRHGEAITFDRLSWLCQVLGCQPGDLMEYVPDPAEDDQMPE